MNAARFAEIFGRYRGLRVAVVGDFFLDRYLQIDPSRAEVSIETGLPVYNVESVRPQAGAAGTIVNNLVALGVGSILAVGFCGEDGEGYELRRALGSLAGVRLDHFLTVRDRKTPVYCKPIVLEPGQPPRELNRFDTKNWTPTPAALHGDFASRIAEIAGEVDAIILMDQVEIPDSGVVCRPVLDASRAAIDEYPGLLVLADSRRGLADFPPLALKMNADELARMTGKPATEVDSIAREAAALAERNRRPVFVTMAERGIVGAIPGQAPEHVPAHPIRGPIDVVGAGDSVTSNLAAAIAAGAAPIEAMELAMAAASLVVHQLGTTGTASVDRLTQLLTITGG